MNSKHNYKAEDYLSDRIPEGEKHMISDAERDLAEDIRSTVKSVQNKRLTSLEEGGLWERIQSNTTNPVRKSNWKLYLQLAAMLTIVLGIGMWQYHKNTSTSKLLEFAAQNLSKKSISIKKPKSNQPDVITVEDNEEENIITANDFNTLVVGSGQRSVIRLPDETRVWLNSGSKLVYPIAFSGDKREVYLEGEAYFDVSHDINHPFYVRTKNMDIKVLGTEFYVSSGLTTSNSYAVLVQGSIAFSAGSWLNKTERQLVPGEKINYNPEESKLLISRVKTDEYESWKAGYLDVTSESLDVIVQRVAKYYNIEISTEGLDLSNEKFSGRLDFQRNAEDVLGILCIGTRYVYNDTERRLELIRN